MQDQATADEHDIVRNPNLLNGCEAMLSKSLPSYSNVTASRRMMKPLSHSDGVARILNRRTIRQFEDKPISEALLTQLLACAQSAPSKSELQQYGIVVVDDAEKRADCRVDRHHALIVEASHQVPGRYLRNRTCPNRGTCTPTTTWPANAVVDGTVALQSFVLGARRRGSLVCRPGHAQSRRTPGDTAGFARWRVLSPAWRSVPNREGKPSMRLLQSVVVHRDRYDDSNMVADVTDYGDRRHEVDPIGAGNNGIRTATV